MEPTENKEPLAAQKLALNELLLKEYLAGLTHESPKVRRKAAHGIGGLGRLAVGAIPLLETLLKDRDRKVRDAAKAALESVRTLS